MARVAYEKCRFQLSGLGWRPRSYISTRFPGDANAASPETTLRSKGLEWGSCVCYFPYNFNATQLGTVHWWSLRNYHSLLFWLLASALLVHGNHLSMYMRG